MKPCYDGDRLGALLTQGELGQIETVILDALEMLEFGIDDAACTPKVERTLKLKKMQYQRLLVKVRKVLQV